MKKYSEIKSYCNEKYQLAKYDHDKWINAYCIENNWMLDRMQQWKMASNAKSKREMLARMEIASETREERLYLESCY